jgi:hypothetical protein
MGLFLRLVNLYYYICVDCRRPHFGSAIALYAPAPAVPAPHPAIPPRPSMEGPAAPAIRAINASPAVRSPAIPRPQSAGRQCKVASPVNARSPRPSMEGRLARSPQAVNGRSRHAFIAIDGRSRQLPQSAPAPAVRARHASDAPADRKAPWRR